MTSIPSYLIIFGFLLIETFSLQMCELVNQTDFEDLSEVFYGTSGPKLLVNVDIYTQIKDGCQQNFFLTINPSLKSKFVNIQITFHNFSSNPLKSPRLLADLKKTPIVFFDKGNIEYSAGYEDLEGFGFRRYYQNIEIYTGRDVMNISDTIDWFNKASDFDPETISYEISIRINNDCRYSCTDNGICSSFYCECAEGFFDVDCSKFVYRLYKAGSFSSYSKPYNYTFAIIPVFAQTSLKNFPMRIQAESKDYIVYIQYNLRNDWSLPSRWNYDVSFSNFTEGYNVITLNSEKQYMSYVSIAVWNPTASVFKIGFALPDDFEQEFSVSIYILIYLGGLLIFIFLNMGLVLLCRCRRRNNNGGPANIIQRPQIQLLSKEDIQKFFPRKEFQQEPPEYEQPTCTICLEDFEPTVICREIIPCRHFFHAECIDSWFASKNRCPNCNVVIDLDEIQAFLDDKEKGEEIRTIKSPSDLKQAEGNGTLDPSKDIELKFENKPFEVTSSETRNPKSASKNDFNFEKEDHLPTLEVKGFEKSVEKVDGKPENLEENNSPEVKGKKLPNLLNFANS